MTNYLSLYLSSHFSFRLHSPLSLFSLSHADFPHSSLSNFYHLSSSPSQASKIDSLRSKVDLLRLPLALSAKSISDRKSQLGVVWEKGGGSGAGGPRKPRPPPASDMDNESTYSGYSYKSSHSRSSRKHR